MRADVSLLKQNLEEKFPGVWQGTHKRQKIIPTGIAAIDGCLRGLARGRISLWSGPASSGKTTLLRDAIANWCRSGLHVAYVDSQRQLSASDWAYLEDYPGRFWVVRPPEAKGPQVPNTSKTALAVWCTDCLLKSRAFDLVVLDLGLAPYPKSRNYARLQRLLAQAKTALVIVGNGDLAQGGWGYDSCLNFCLNNKAELEAGLNGTLVILPVVNVSISRDGLTQNQEIAQGKDGKAHVTNCLFTHSPVPDRRAPKT